ncbi:uncharacterized protein LOC108110536 [Drosophila eugracilis]|uniref:uncharacterized protein LOC108110536 n=1 Tax=Drosophila eugracilis TaxID=29029 RepID=UPI001BDA3B20|nr:uncharacterized protein LOC108110536 [Drosophila eugracilis]
MNDGNMKMPQDLQSKIFGLAGSCSSEGSSDPSATSCCPVSRSLANGYKDECKIECCDEGGSDRPPYTKVMPEDRRFGVVIVNEECPDSCDFTCILMFLAEAFHEAEDAETLNFSECTPAVVFDCSLLIVAADSDTSDWILKAARPMSPTYSANPFIKHFQLVRCTFVIPMIVEEPLCKVFYIIEKQNAGLNTGKWCVMKKAKLDPCSLDYPSKAIYQSGDNYELVVYICLDSKCYIENHCARIRYMLWNLPVEFIQGFKCS